ncbi:hypothetical protein L596_029455 [Steinernema carpocapsae]|uniref:Uncharacterized protein n=1 Tax=Steinernema carpocapsae TaxID=34508 RepID=A0A4U5LUQ2_STECR|nr:hypothetical protein L596_029455 [Steinernema carpocapsae]
MAGASSFNLSEMNQSLNNNQDVAVPSVTPGPVEEVGTSAEFMQKVPESRKRRAEDASSDGSSCKVQIVDSETATKEEEHGEAAVLLQCRRIRIHVSAAVMHVQALPEQLDPTFDEGIDVGSDVEDEEEAEEEMPGQQGPP